MTYPPRPIVTLKKKHADQFGCHAALQSLTSIYATTNDLREPLAQEHLHWAIFDVQALTFTTRFVLVAAGDAVWDLGWHSIKEGIAQLIADYRATMGSPTTVSQQSDLEPDGVGSLWFLQTPANEYYWIAHEVDTDFIHLNPVPSLDPRFAPGSQAALCALFPQNAEHGVEAMATQFAGPRRDTVGLIPMALSMPSN